MATKTKKKPEQRTVYQFKEGARYSLDPQVVGEELARIEGVYGCVIPSTVVEEARPEESPCHPAFEWDNEEAAERYREDQARALIRSVVVVTTGDGPNEPQVSHAFVSSTDENGDRGYRTTAKVLSDDEMREEVINETVGMIRGLQRRLKQFNLFPKIRQAIEEELPEAG